MSHGAQYSSMKSHTPARMHTHTHVFCFQLREDTRHAYGQLQRNGVCVPSAENNIHGRRIDVCEPARLCLRAGVYHCHLISFHRRNLQQKFLAERWAALKGGNKTAAARVNELMELADFEQMEKVRARAAATVDDPATAEALKPYYRQFCKRPCFHDDYLPTFNRDNVTLVDTDGKGVERITPEGVVVGGREYKVDCIVMATGFETGYTAQELGTQKAGYELVGRGGITLSQKWAEGPRTFNSMNTHGFPNLFMQNAPQGTFTTNFVMHLDEVARHAAHIIAKMRQQDFATFEPSKAAEDAYCQRIYDKSGRGQKFLQKCTPGYYNNEGTATCNFLNREEALLACVPRQWLHETVAS